MLSKHRCPYTGVVNFFTETDPFVAVGSIVKAGERAEFHWRWYDAKDTIAGIAHDMKTAEQRVRCEYRRVSAEQSAH
ncbi:MAG: hypothetical protein AB7O43_00280 [Hyphomicrobiaceae bacterium]